MSEMAIDINLKMCARGGGCRLGPGELGSIDVDVDLTLTGFSTGEIDVILSSVADPDDEVIPPVSAMSLEATALTRPFWDLYCAVA